MLQIYSVPDSAWEEMSSPHEASIPVASGRNRQRELEREWEQEEEHEENLDEKVKLGEKVKCP